MKKILIAAASLILLTPSIALAAWWNPFTWFPPKIVPQISATSSVATTSVTIVATTTPKIVQKKIISKPSVPVTQTSVVNTPVTTTQPIISSEHAAVLQQTKSICQNGYTYSSTSGCILTNPIVPPTLPVLTTDQKIAALEQQIIDIKTKALQESTEDEEDPNALGDSGKLGAEWVINQANNQIEQINLQIQQLELNTQTSQ
jgi:hypothetical protein